MHTMVGFIKKPESISTEDFRQWWLTKHVPHVLQIPGLRNYVVSPIDFSFYPETGDFTAPAPYDGVAILYFDDEQSIRDAFTTPTGVSDREHFNKMGLISVVVVGEAIVQRGEITQG